VKNPLKESLLVAAQKLNEFVAARAEIDKQRATIDAQIIQWKQLVDSLRAVCADENEQDPSDVEVSGFVEGKPGRRTVKFTDGVRMVFKRNQNAALTAPEIRVGLLNLGFDFSKYSQPLTPIHNCLKRLEEQGEVKPEKTALGAIVGYRWISPIERALAEDSPDLSGYREIQMQWIDPQHGAVETVRRFAEQAEANRFAAEQAAQRVADAEVAHRKRKKD
jgi:hypothetical protein